MRRRALSDGTAAAAGMAQPALEKAVRLLRLAVEAGEIAGAVLLAARRGVVVVRRAVGRTAAEPRGRPLREDDVFGVSSLTQPLVALPLLQLAEAGEVLLDDPVARFLPEFAGEGRDAVLLRHLLCHTSGLPAQAPDHEALVAAQATLEAYAQAACRAPLVCEPGTRFGPSEPAFLLAATIVERICGRPMADVLQNQLFGPLQIRASFLGWRDGFERRLVPGPATDYQRRLAAPWDGLHTVAGDLAVLLQMMLNGGSYGDVTLLGPAAALEATRNQLALLPGLIAGEAQRHPHGLGWRLGGPAADWPAFLSAEAFGQTDSGGCGCWADPASELLVVLLTAAPQASVGRLLTRVGSIIAAAWR